MALQTSASPLDPLCLSEVRAHFGIPATQRYCMSDYLNQPLRITTNQKELNLRTWALSNGWNGSSAVTIEVAPGVYIWSDNTAVAGLTINGSWPGGVTLVNNGFIMGRGGNAGGNTTDSQASNGNAGGPAISLGINCTIRNNSYIAGGGGGGATHGGGGGGGAGGGIGGRGFNRNPTNYAVISVYATDSIPGAVGAASTNCASGASGGGSAGGGGGFARVFIAPGNLPPIAGAGASGGRILPGVGGAGYYGVLNVSSIASGTGGTGGSSNNTGGNSDSGGVTTSGYTGGGGGGGWGAAGGNTLQSTTTTYTGGAGGRAVQLNGFSVTWLALGNRWGAIS